MSDQADILFPQRSPIELEILSVLEERVGHAKAISMRDLAVAVGLGEDTRTLQDLIKHLVEEHREPIGSSPTQPNGYFMIKTADDQKTAFKHIDSRIISLAKRKARIVGNTPAEVLRELTGQLDLELQGAVTL